MDFHELTAFVALAKHLHFARAASSVNSSPSAMSRILSRLEDEVGAELCVRDTRSVQLTDAGRIFLTFAEESLRRFEELEGSIGSREGNLRGTLRVFASVTACYSILPPFVETLGLLHSELKLSIETGDPADAERLLREGIVDVALAAISEEGLKGYPSFSVQKTPLVFVASKTSGYQAVDPDSISEIPLILPRRGLARIRFDDWIRTHAIRPHISAETAGNEAILALARLGLGLGLIPRLVLENSPFAEGLTVVEHRPHLDDYDIGFVLSEKTMRKSQSLFQALQVVLNRSYPDGTWIDRS